MLLEFRRVLFRSWGDWLGTGTIAPFNRSYRSFEEVRFFAHSLGLKNQHQWRDWVKTKDRPIDIPADPASVYKDKGWIGWGDWLGTGTIAPFNRSYRSFEEACIFARSLGLKNQHQWRDWAKTKDRPADIPANPDKTDRKRHV